MTEDADADAGGDGDTGVETEPARIDEATLAAGWRVWTEEPSGRAVVVYRPDVFDADRFPAPCLPTVYLTNGSRRARPGAGQRQTDEWHVTLFLEPDVEATSRTFSDREAAVDALYDVTAAFAAGEVDYRGAYQVPRETYLAELDELVG